MAGDWSAFPRPHLRNFRFSAWPDFHGLSRVVGGNRYRSHAAGGFRPEPVRQLVSLGYAGLAPRDHAVPCDAGVAGGGLFQPGSETPAIAGRRGSRGVCVLVAPYPRSRRSQGAFCTVVASGELCPFECHGGGLLHCGGAPTPIPNGEHGISILSNEHHRIFRAFRRDPPGRSGGVEAFLSRGDARVDRSSTGPPGPCLRPF